MRADVRGGNADHSLLSRSGSLEIALHHAPQGHDLRRISGARVSHAGSTEALDKGRKTLLLHDGVSLVFKKSCSTECVHQVLCHAPDLRTSEHADELLLQVQFCMNPVKEPKAGYERWGNDELSVGIAVSNRE